MDDFFVHASCIEINNQGVLLLGKSGSGKSDLALRLIDRGAIIVSDDQVRLQNTGNSLMAFFPEKYAGLIEIRGLGIIRLKHYTSTKVLLAVQLAQNSDEIERMPETEYYACGGRDIPCIRLFPFEASAAIKVEMAVASLCDSAMVV